jgi:hypothetical protein
MNIVDPSPTDITLDEAVRITGRCAKTLRRAAQEGRLPRRYVMGTRGPQLVFDRVEIAQWLAEKQGRAAGPASAAPPVEAATAERIEDLQRALDRSQAGLERALAVLARQQVLLEELARSVAVLSGQAGAPPDGAMAPAPPVTADV